MALMAILGCNVRYLLTGAAGAAAVGAGGSAHFRDAESIFSAHSENVHVGDLEIVQGQIG